MTPWATPSIVRCGRSKSAHGPWCVAAFRRPCPPKSHWDAAPLAQCSKGCNGSLPWWHQWSNPHWWPDRVCPDRWWSNHHSTSPKIGRGQNCNAAFVTRSTTHLDHWDRGTWHRSMQNAKRWNLGQRVECRSSPRWPHPHVALRRPGTWHKAHRRLWVGRQSRLQTRLLANPRCGCRQHAKPQRGPSRSHCPACHRTHCTEPHRRPQCGKIGPLGGCSQRSSFPLRLG